MQINKQKVEKFLAFTLAEVLIAMIIITLMTLASIPVIKKSKEYREVSKDKNTWMAMYDQNNNLKVYVDGNPRDDLVVNSGSEQYAKFIPPKGVTRFNVTVVGGGGGGAAGEAGIGQTKTFFPENNGEYFVPARDGLYQVVAVGAGGGGGGGGIGCSGGGGFSGELIVATAELKKNIAYEATVGQGGQGGKSQKFATIIGKTLLWGGLVVSLAGGFLTGGATWAITGTIIGTAVASSVTGSLVLANQPKDRMDGGGVGFGSIFHGSNVHIVASGGCGGEHVRPKGWLLKCKGVKKNKYACDGAATNIFGATRAEGSGIKSHEILSQSWKEAENKKKPAGYICKRNSSGSLHCVTRGGNLNSSKNIDATKIESIFKDVDPAEFGAGGRGGAGQGSGSNAQDGFIQVYEIATYGGGAGQAGAVSFYTYTKSPLENGEEFVKVYPGRGGFGGQSSAENGKDGTFSRFGNRIIADGGLGGRIRATNISNSKDLEAEGEDGIPSSIPTTLSDQIKYPGANFIKDIYGGIKHNKSCTTNGKYDGLGQSYGASNISCQTNDILIPGSGGAGGGAKGTENYDLSKTIAGKGGNGASGIVIVTW